MSNDLSSIARHKLKLRFRADGAQVAVKRHRAEEERALMWQKRCAVGEDSPWRVA
jgi:hypothetical protein